jgi:hypothetical protein
MKVSVAAILLAATGSAAYQQPTRSTLRNLGQKTVSFQGPNHNVGSTMKMEGAYEKTTTTKQKFSLKNSRRKMSPQK